MAVDTNFHIKVAAAQTSVLDLGTASITHLIESSLQWSSGVGLNQADRAFSDTRTLGPSATENLDVAGSLVDALGATITMARLKGVIIRAAVANTNDVLFSRPAANGVTMFSAVSDAIVIRPGGVFVWLAPDATAIPVTAGTSDLLTVTNSAAGTSVTYDVILLGAST